MDHHRGLVGVVVLPRFLHRVVEAEVVAEAQPYGFEVIECTVFPDRHIQPNQVREFSPMARHDAFRFWSCGERQSFLAGPGCVTFGGSGNPSPSARFHAWRFASASVRFPMSERWHFMSDKLRRVGFAYGWAQDARQQVTLTFPVRPTAYASATPAAL